MRSVLFYLAIVALLTGASLFIKNGHGTIGKVICGVLALASIIIIVYVDRKGL
jgi:hypothetical protein